MYSKEPNWLIPEDIIKVFSDFCFDNQISERRIIDLFDAFLLRGRDNRNKRKVEILQESFELLQDHIRYQLYKQGSKAEAKIIMPDYLKHKYEIFYDGSQNWYTPKEALSNYPFLKNEKHFTSKFIGELAKIGLISGKYQPADGCYYILLPSFVDMMKYRDHCVEQSRMLPPRRPS